MTEKTNKKGNNWLIVLILIFVGLISGTVVKEFIKDLNRSPSNDLIDNIKYSVNEGHL
jgi:uncharacterized membrane protein YwzB